MSSLIAPGGLLSDEGERKLGLEPANPELELELAKPKPEPSSSGGA